MTGTIAVLGLGEAGSELARDLATAGAVVRAYDPAVAAAAAGVVVTKSEAEAADGADLVLSVNSASAARPSPRSAGPGTT
ncbi:NAD(P)-binding domain-containing protein [Amycolatopsis lexingtonensis]|uniref:NAD(P)-binding domain-containing protein n=1 Tax=Amycolatopsis lexingtonensis TaxID=218822 RepID=UPI002012EEDD|nr:NAD(P)-binding domain-containing protein [Amycolatopsis lexingtonensis]